MREELLHRYVVDASIVVKWYSKSGEGDLRKADLLLEGCIQKQHVLVAPSSISYELTNALRFNPNFSEEDVVKAVSAFSQLYQKVKDLLFVIPLSQLG